MNLISLIIALIKNIIAPGTSVTTNSDITPPTKDNLSPLPKENLEINRDNALEINKSMLIEVNRFSFQDLCTIGNLWIDGVDTKLFTLELPVREIIGQPVSTWKIDGKTAIPYGKYKVIVNHSAHFNKDLPLLLNVPGFEGVRIHPGNSDKDSEGCILVGETWAGGDFIGNSKAAFETIFNKIKLASSVEIEILSST